MCAFQGEKPLTNRLLVADAVTLTLQVVIAGKPLIEERGHITGFAIVRLSHSALLPPGQPNSNITCLYSLYRHPLSLSAGSERFTLLHSRPSSTAGGYCPECPGLLSEKRTQQQTTYCRSDRSSFHPRIVSLRWSCRQHFYLA